MTMIHIRPTHYTYHQAGLPPRVRVLSDMMAAKVRIEFAGSAQLLAPANGRQRTPDNYFDSWAGTDDAVAQPLQLANGSVTYTMPLPVWRRLAAANRVLFYRAAATTATRPQWTAQPPTVIYTATDGWAARGTVPYFGIPHDQLHEPWLFPDMGAYNQVEPYYRAKLLLIRRHTDANECAYLLRRLVGHDSYTALPEAKRAQALLLFAATNNEARRALLQLFGRQIPSTASGQPAMAAILNTDLSSQRASLLDHLAALIEIDPHMLLPETMDTIIADVLREIADPHYELNQGTKGTCVPTSVQWIMATYFPAEYVRILLTLLAQQGAAQLANGAVATTPPDTYAYDPNEQSTHVQRFLHRSWSERIFQATLMNYARPGLTYSNLRDVFTDKRGGLTSSELERLMTGLRNVIYTTMTGTGATLVHTVSERLQQPSLPILLAARWGPPSNQGGHQVVAVAADRDTITIRNPWGRMNYQVGQQLQNPPRRSTNPSRGEEALAQHDLANWIANIVIPRD